jgi:hypothetical protein
MSEVNEKIAKRIAYNQAFDGYAAWRMLKDVNARIFLLERRKSAVPIELLRLRWLIARAREIRKASQGSEQIPVALKPAVPQLTGGFDAFDFVDHYRALGGRRIAWALDEGIKLGPMDGDAPEAAQFWLRTWSSSAATTRNAILEALLLRGRY